MSDARAPVPQSPTPPVRYLGTRHSLVDLGQHLELRDRLFPDHVLGRFPSTADGRAAALAELRRLDGNVFDPSSGRPLRSPSDRRARPRSLWIALGLCVILVVTLVPRLLREDRRLAGAGVNGGPTSELRPLTSDEVLTRVRRGTMLVVTYRGEVPSSAGSGWIYDLTHGLVVTNAHVVDGGSTFLVGRPGGSLVRASLLGTAPCVDLAVLQLSLLLEYDALELAPKDPPAAERVAAMGYPPRSDGPPEQTPLQWSFGNVTDTAVRVLNGPSTDLIEHSARISGGNSGGPLVDMYGRVVGVNAGYAVDDREVSFAIPVSEVRAVVPGLSSGKNVC